MENNKDETKYSTRVLFIYIHLFISFVIVIGETFSGFKNTLMAYHSLNFEENFVRKKFYYVDYETDSRDSNSKRNYIYGIIEDDLPNDFDNRTYIEKFRSSPRLMDEFQRKLREKYNDRIIIYRSTSFFEFIETDEKGKYVNVWYNPKLKKVYSINYTGIDTETFLFHFLFTIWIIPEIWYLRILRKREKRALLESEKTST